MARKMKDSGIEWIGDIPEGWEVVPVRSCFDEVRTKNTDGQEQNALQFKSGNIISKANFNANTDDYVADTITNYTVVLPDTVMINGLNLNYDFKSLRVALVKEKGVITSAYLAIFPDRKKISPQYATYLFKGYETKMAFHNMGAGIRKTLGYKEFKNQPLLLPSKEEQNKISAYLDSKCSHIDIMLSKIRSSIEEYKKFKQAVITQAVTKGVRGEREMKDSGVEWIGEIPKTWIISNIGRFCFVTKLAGFEYTKEMDGHISPYGDVPIVRAQNIKMGRFIPNTREYISLALSQKLSRCALNEKCLIITFIGAGIGEVALFSDATRHHLAPNVAKIVINHDMKQFLDDRFLLYFLMSSAGQEEVNKIKKATAQPSLSMQTIRSIKLAFPSTLQEQKEIADYLDAKCAEIDGLVAKKEQLVKELESYKKSLIYEVVTGKREV